VIDYFKISLQFSGMDQEKLLEELKKQTNSSHAWIWKKRKIIEKQLK